MRNRAMRKVGPGCLLVCLLAPFFSGCVHTTQVTEKELVETPVPRELEKCSLPTYVIEPPDILQIDAVAVIPKPPYRVSPGDVLLVKVSNAFEAEPISGAYPVEPEGTVNLGAAYGTISITGKSISEVRVAIEQQLGKIIKDPKVFVALAQSRGLQQVRGQHLVTPDGTVRLGLYGSVKISGMTVAHAKAAIEAHLTQFLQNPEISLDVLAYNSKLYYVIFDGGGSGQTIYRQAVTGNDTVLDALAQVGGLTAVSSTNELWVARPAPAGASCDQILPVDWCGITTRGRTATNYQLMPGDRLYVKANPLVATDTYLARLFAPVERVLGIVLLGNSTVQALRNNNNNNNGNTTNNNGIIR